MELYAEYGISDNGQTIVGYGTNATGYCEAFIAHIPEPTTIGLLAVQACYRFPADEERDPLEQASERPQMPSATFR